MSDFSLLFKCAPGDVSYNSNGSMNFDLSFEPKIVNTLVYKMIRVRTASVGGVGSKSVFSGEKSVDFSLKHCALGDVMNSLNAMTDFDPSF